VDMDRQTFIELSEADVRSCQGRAGAVCPPRGAIYRKNFRKTCAMALFLQDPERTKADCDKVVVEWRGQGCDDRDCLIAQSRPRSLFQDRDSDRDELKKTRPGPGSHD
jgi:hypothetical protein